MNRSDGSIRGDMCLKLKNNKTPNGSEPLPDGIIAKTSNLERRPLWGYPEKKEPCKYLFAAAVGIKQKETVNKMVQKFLSSDFVVMLFHYDGIVDGWRSFRWSNSVIHILALNQTKWWFAKRFLHPDIVAEYISIVRDESLEISQPALDIGKSEVHHHITARGRRSRVHRTTYKAGDTATRCDYTSTAPPCTGWIEVMAPVFSNSAWSCVWYMIQVRRQSYNEYEIFKRRWKQAIEEDTCWTDPYVESEK
ncbi:hypothetical protein RND71_025213 [Anisodus tanguticus]|uniref:Uncharacterized protein n=1 Tax=Anisodus tanguticus TaxID=243964 RepID=A0AAE1V5L1_9SOLA|nr:hypothetical protein RND71_025213 [Anisodus tanguticus]